MVIEKLGLTFNEVINALYRKIAATNEIPFRLTPEQISNIRLSRAVKHLHTKKIKHLHTKKIRRKSDLEDFFNKD